MNKTAIKGYLASMGAGIIFGCVPLCSKLIYAEGMNSFSLLFFRNFMAVPMLLIVLAIKREKLAVEKQKLGKILLIVLFGMIATPLLLYSSYNFISSGTSTVFHYIYPAVVILGGALVLHEKLERSALLCVLLCTAGIACFYDPAQPINLTGAALALTSGIAFATYAILLSRFELGGMSRFKLSLYMFGMGAVIMLPISLATGKFVAPPTARCWALCLVFSFFDCVLAYLLFQIGTQTIGAGRASILSTLEPITSLIVGVIVFHEKLSPLSLVGAVLVISSSVLIAVLDMRKSESKQSA